MKRWFVKVDGSEYACEITGTYLTSMTKLKLIYLYQEFMVIFVDRSEYISARNGNWVRINISTIRKSKNKVCEIIFKEI